VLATISALLLHGAASARTIKRIMKSGYTRETDYSLARGAADRVDAVILTEPNANG
jgi:hypothetical protein